MAQPFKFATQELQKALEISIAVNALYSLNFRHKKRRPWTSLDVEVVGRGNLNWSIKILISIDNFRLNICLEYLLEYQLINLNSGRCRLRLIVARGKACALSLSV